MLLFCLYLQLCYLVFLYLQLYIYVHGCAYTKAMTFSKTIAYKQVYKSAMFLFKSYR